ncbi:peptidyl-prolyl cis-trans isomerase FKBP18, chloroplastic isoform X2 [Argentina anserina]|uniref:peptidyl-prolyl cis-trans isomerase FKBP18, chloroplastic isoform X2 n=1 Tax=Argentina anserina TaxID=57926 RepID=UPI002176806F|nr:peptidyl-prolyl cis-trans isomerase FKBP18, chloroplastic isoform X2 [Potentilla anserina]
MASSPIRCLHLPSQLHHQTQFAGSSIWKPSNTRRTQVHVVNAEQQNEAAAAISRRSCANILITWLPAALTLISASPAYSEARLRRNRKAIPLEDYKTTPDGLKYYDLVEGRGPVAEKGSTVQVHFDCLYRGITAVSSRESKILAGNRIIAQPYIFKVGAPPGKERKREFVDNANGLFSAQAAPKPPRAMYSVTEGMKVGGKRTVIVPPEAGYGPKGMNEIPPGATFELNLELLQLNPPSD